MNGSLQIFPDFDALNVALVRHWQSMAETAIAARGAFHVALAGGGTPRYFYQSLARLGSSDHSLWAQTHCYFGDERCVPQDHMDSNYRMARETLLSHVPIQAAQVYPMFDPAYNPRENAERYATLLAHALPQNEQGYPVFDFILLGIGEDGHTASLFPGSEILQETQQVVAAQYVEAKQAWRISLTFPVINAARSVVLQVAGGAKAEIMAAIAQNDSGEIRYPVEQVDPAGQLLWFLDREAASLMPEPGPA